MSHLVDVPDVDCSFHILILLLLEAHPPSPLWLFGTFVLFKFSVRQFMVRRFRICTIHVLLPPPPPHHKHTPLSLAHHPLFGCEFSADLLGHFPATTGAALMPLLIGGPTHIDTSTHTHAYIYIYVYWWAAVCAVGVACVVI